VAAVCAGQLGCYKRVVRADEYATDVEEVYEPNRSDEPDLIDKLDSAIWGDSDSEKSDWRD
jgi:hypothetical protein